MGVATGAGVLNGRVAGLVTDGLACGFEYGVGYAGCGGRGDGALCGGGGPYCIMGRYIGCGGGGRGVASFTTYITASKM